MDLNKLYFDHQLLLMQAEHEPCQDRRDLHREGAALIAGRIGCMQGAMGAAAARGWAETAGLGSNRTGCAASLPFGPSRGPHDWRRAAQGAGA